MVKGFTHFIFDFDGVVANTEEVFAAFDARLLSEVMQQAGQQETIDQSYTRKLAGKSGLAKLDFVANDFNFDAAPYADEFEQKRNLQRKDLFKQEKAEMGKNLIPFLQALDQRYALATNKSAPKFETDTEIMDLQYLFDIAVCCDPPLTPKPEPDVILKAMEILNAPAHSTAYIGDNVSDIIAAKRAGVTPIGFVIAGIQNNPEHAQSLQDAGAALIIDDFATLTPYILKPCQNDSTFTY